MMLSEQLSGVQNTDLNKHLAVDHAHAFLRALDSTAAPLMLLLLLLLLSSNVKMMMMMMVVVVVVVTVLVMVMVMTMGMIRTLLTTISTIKTSNFR